MDFCRESGTGLRTRVPKRRGPGVHTGPEASLSALGDQDSRGCGWGAESTLGGTRRVLGEGGLPGWWDVGSRSVWWPQLGKEGLVPVKHWPGELRPLEAVLRPWPLRPGLIAPLPFNLRLSSIRAAPGVDESPALRPVLGAAGQKPQASASPRVLPVTLVLSGAPRTQSRLSN